MKILGFTESVSTCECCGKTELKGTFAILNTDGNIYYYGSTCAFKHGYKLEGKTIMSDAKKAMHETRYKMQAEQSQATKELQNELNQVGFWTEAGKALWDKMDEIKAAISLKYKIA